MLAFFRFLISDNGLYFIAIGNKSVKLGRLLNENLFLGLVIFMRIDILYRIDMTAAAEKIKTSTIKMFI